MCGINLGMKLGIKLGNNLGIQLDIMLGIRHGEMLVNINMLDIMLERCWVVC